MHIAANVDVIAIHQCNVFIGALFNGVQVDIEIKFAKIWLKPADLCLLEISVRGEAAREYQQFFHAFIGYQFVIHWPANFARNSDGLFLQRHNNIVVGLKTNRVQVNVAIKKEAIEINDLCGAIAAANFNFAQCAALANTASIVENIENIGHARANQVCARHVDFAHNIDQQLAHLAKADIDKCRGLIYVSGVDVRGINLR